MTLEDIMLKHMKDEVVPQLVALYVYTLSQQNELDNRTLRYHYDNALLLVEIGTYINFYEMKNKIISILNEVYNIYLFKD